MVRHFRILPNTLEAVLTVRDLGFTVDPGDWLTAGSVTICDEEIEVAKELLEEAGITLEEKHA